MRIRDLFAKKRTDEEDGPPILLCAICIFTKKDYGDVTPADTTINGTAVCADHVYAVYDSQFMSRVAHVRMKEGL